MWKSLTSDICFVYNQIVYDKAYPGSFHGSHSGLDIFNDKEYLLVISNGLYQNKTKKEKIMQKKALGTMFKPVADLM